MTLKILFSNFMPLPPVSSLHGFFFIVYKLSTNNQSILKEINPGYSLEGLMLRLKLQYFGYLMWRTDSLEWWTDAGKDWRQEEKGMTEDEMVGWHHRLDGLEFEHSRSWWWTGNLGVLQSIALQRVRHNWATELNCLDCSWLCVCICLFIVLFSFIKCPFCTWNTARHEG